MRIRGLFGAAANPHGHGHNYVFEVTLEGDPDPVTGMVFDLKELKDILNREVIDPYRSPLSESRGAAVRPRGADAGEYRHRHLEPSRAAPSGTAAPGCTPFASMKRTIFAWITSEEAA